MGYFLDYERFVKIKNEFDTLLTIEEKINLWDREELQDFMYLINHDEKKVTESPNSFYIPRQFSSMANLLCIEGKNDDENLVLATYASTLDNSNRYKSFEELKENYWKNISKSAIPERYFELEHKHYAIRLHEKDANKFPQQISDCYYTGYSNGLFDGELGLKRTILYLWVKGTETRITLKDYGQGINIHKQGFHNAQFEGFLLKQKKRLDRGEDISYPANTDTSKSVQTKEKKTYSQRAYALKYVYCQESTEYPKLTKNDWIELGKKLGFSRRFYQTFLEINNPNKRKQYRKDIQAAIELLGEYPLALQFAQKELSNSTK